MRRMNMKHFDLVIVRYASGKLGAMLEAREEFTEGCRAAFGYRLNEGCSEIERISLDRSDLLRHAAAFQQAANECT